jgi:outer membrane biosynthesis protein TonB
LNRTSFALFVALIIHLLLLSLFLLLYKIVDFTPIEPKKKPQRIKISLKEKPLPVIKRKVIKKASKAIKKQKYKKRITKKIKTKPITKLNKISKIKKEIQRAKPLPSFKEFTFTPPKHEYKKRAKKEEEKSLFDILSEDKSQETTQEKKSVRSEKSSISSNIKELYGDKFKELSKAQQDYILDNEEIMRRITQRVLTRVASVNLKRNLNVNRTNVIEFYLHPNGDMSDFKFLKKSGYFVLDETTKETIEYAYSKYPRVKEKTLIRYNVYYNLARY